MIESKHVLILAVAILAASLIVGLGICGAAYIYVTRSVAAHEQLQQDVQQQVQETKESDRRAEQGQREQKAHITRTSEKVRTPMDVVASLPLIQSPFAGTVKIEQPSPEAPSQLVITDPRAFFEAAADCASAKVDLGACTVKLENANKRADLQEKRAEDAEKIMKGGGFWSRVKSNSRWFLIGGLAGAGVAYAATH